MTMAHPEAPSAYSCASTASCRRNAQPLLRDKLLVNGCDALPCALGCVTSICLDTSENRSGYDASMYSGMPARTAHRFGLEVFSLTEDRRKSDPVKGRW